MNVWSQESKHTCTHPRGLVHSDWLGDYEDATQCINHFIYKRICSILIHDQLSYHDLFTSTSASRRTRVKVSVRCHSSIIFAMVMERTVLLFCHAAGLSKTAWNPIIRRVAASPLLERHPCEFVAFDWRYHGTKSDHKDLGTISFRNGDKNMPEVEHETKYWTSWAPEELYDHIQDLRADDEALSRKTKIIGIGHSMGGTSLIKLESTRSGLLDGIIVFDPVCNAMAMTPDPFLFSSKMVANTLRRQEKWNSWDEVRDHFHTFKGYSRWDKESADAFIEGGVIPSENGTYRLACAPPQEAAIYCHNMLHFTEEDHQKLGCKVIYEHAELSKLFNAQVLSEIATALPDKVVVSPAVEKVTHMMTMEDPAVCAERIIQNLPRFPVFQGKAASKL